MVDKNSLDRIEILRNAYIDSVKALRVKLAPGSKLYPEVNTYADLPDATTVSGYVYLVLENTYVAYIFNVKPAGLYRSNGTTWDYVGALPSIVADNNFKIYDDSDFTRQIAFNAGNISTLATRTITMANRDIDLDYLGQDVKTTASPEFADVNITTLATDSLIGNTAKSVLDFLNKTWAYVKTVFLDTQDPTGIPPAERAKFTLSYNYSNQVLTLTKISDWFYYYKGQKVVVNSNLTATAHANAYGTYYYYFNDTSKAITVSDTPFDIPSTAQISYVLYNPTATDTIKGFAFEERHGIQMDGKTHEYEHNENGAVYRSGGNLADYVLNTDTTAATSYSITPTTFADEDITTTTAAQADGSNYVLMWRTAAGQWDWLTGQSLPYIISNNNITYNPAGSALVEVSTTNRFFNNYPIVTNAISTTFQNIILVGRALYTSLASAQAEDFGTYFSRTGFLAEFVPIHKITIRYQARYSNTTGKSAIASVQNLRGAVNITGATPATDHLALNNINGGQYTDGGHTNLTQQTISASSAPTGDSDIDSFKEGSHWIKQDDNSVYHCADNADGNAVWYGINQSLLTTSKPTFAGDTLNGTGDSNTGVQEINVSGTGAFKFASTALGASLATTNNIISTIGVASTTKNSGYYGFRYVGAGSNDNLLTFGLFGADNLMNLNGLGYLGLGTLTPSNRLEVYSTLSSTAGFSATGEGIAGIVRAKRLNGTYSSPTGILSGENVGRFIAIGQNTDGNTTACGIISVIAEANFGAVNNAPTAMTFFTSNTTSLNERMRIASNGNLGIGNTAPKNQLSLSTCTGFSEVNAVPRIINNTYLDGTTWRRLIARNGASIINMESTGAYNFYANSDAGNTAGSAITWDLKFGINSYGVNIPGTITTNYTTITTNTYATADYDLILCNASGDITVWLPYAYDWPGLILTIKNINTGLVAIDADQDDEGITIDGSRFKYIYTQHTSYTMQSDGTHWRIK